VLCLIWLVIAKGLRWSFAAVAISMGTVQVFGFISDTFFDNKNLVANIISTAVLVLGLVLSKPTPVNTSGLSGFARRD
jgi:hypothetical protein